MNMKKTIMAAWLVATAAVANAQDPSAWTKGQEVTDLLQWTDYRCVDNAEGGWQTKGDNVDLWVSPCFELWSNNGTNEAGTEVYQTFYLPAGTYEFHVNGFYRNTGSGSSSLLEIENGNIVNGAVVFCATQVDETGTATADTKEFTRKMADFSQTLTDSPLWERTEEWWDDGDGLWTTGDGREMYYPQCQRGCVPRFFDLDICKNVLTIVQAADGYVRLGIRKVVTNTNNTVDFANFRAFYIDEPSAGVELIMNREEYYEASAAAEKHGDRYQTFGSLFSLYTDALMAIDEQCTTAETAEAYRQAVNDLEQLRTTFDTYLDDAVQLQNLIKLADEVAAATNYPGIDAYRQSVDQAKALLADEEQQLVTSGEAYREAYTTLQSARAAYAMSQEKNDDGSWDFTSLVAYPFFVDMQSNPTWNAGLGIWQFPDEVTRDNVHINNGEYWYDTDGSGWRHYGLDEHANMYCANHWTQHWGAMALTQEISGLPDGYYSIAGLGMGGNGYQLESMWIEISSGENVQASPHGTWKAGFWEGGSVYDWYTFKTDIIKVTDGTVRVAFCDDGDNHLSFTGMQLFYYGAEPDFRSMLQSQIDNVAMQGQMLMLGGDRSYIDSIVGSIAGQLPTIDDYYAAEQTLAQAKDYINAATNYLATYDITTLYALLADDYEGDTQIQPAIDVAINKSFDAYDDPAATYKDIQTLYADYEAYVHYFQTVTEYRQGELTDELTAKINEQMLALAQDDGYADLAHMADYERQLAAISHHDYFATLDTQNASPANPVDVTACIKNASLAQAGKYWTGNVDIDTVTHVAQAQASLFDFRQTLYSMPAGKYLLRMKGLYRDGSLADAINHAWTGEGYVPNFQLYLGDTAVCVKSIATDEAMWSERSFSAYTFQAINPETEEPETLRAWTEDTEEDVDGVPTLVTRYWREGYNEDDMKVTLDDAAGAWIYDTPFDAGIETLFFPNSTRGAAIRFADAANVYDNAVTFELTAEGDITLGARKVGSETDDWCAFTDFRLYYIGTSTSSTAIDNISGNFPAGTSGAIYDIAGNRRLLPMRGFNIIDGQKVLVK